MGRRLPRKPRRGMMIPSPDSPEGKGHLTRMNAVLRSYVAAQKHGPQR